ncbi:MAG: ABC transporter transmembrane domain-containing protein, partial [Candidatus Marinimicrobia bacterium]|nr:ABC transporter transmembrane domain-containing protein [Candidatus Neomarinimicrobiota bacterium]
MSKKKDKFDDPLEKHGIINRLKYRRMARKGDIPDEYEGTQTEKDIKKKMRQNTKIRKGWGLFAQFMKDHKFRYLLGVLSIVVVNVLSIATPMIIGQIVDMIKKTVMGTENLTLRRLLILCIVIVAIAVGKLVANFTVRYLLLGASNLMEYVMRKKMFSKLVDLSMAYFNRKNAGDIMALSTNDLRALRQAIGRGIMMITNAFVLLGAGFIYLSIKMSLPLTLAIMAPFPIIVFITAKFGKFIHLRFKTVQETFSDISSKTEENISGIRIIKAFVQEEQEKENFAGVNRKNY